MDERRRSFVGTPNYIAPEVIVKHDERVSEEGHSFEVDMWSLGVCMFAMLTGCFPFKGEDKDKTFIKILKI